MSWAGPGSRFEATLYPKRATGATRSIACRRGVEVIIVKISEFIREVGTHDDELELTSRTDIVFFPEIQASPNSEPRADAIRAMGGRHDHADPELLRSLERVGGRGRAVGFTALSSLARLRRGASDC